MSNNKLLKIVLLVVIFLAAMITVGCSRKTSESEAADKSDIFVDTDAATGEITLRVTQTMLPVAETTSFRVNVTDVNGNPVPQMRISCDTERGLAIVEPNTGTEMTDAWGQMSGVVGCEAPGSFQMACRLPIGANKRKFETIVCTGDAPVGFTGFGDSAGGTLGGGVDTSDDESESEFGVRVTGVSFNDMGQTGIYSIDVTQDICDPTAEDPSEIYESFFDAYVNFTVANDTNLDVRLTKYSYIVEDIDGAGTNYSSPQLAFLGPIEIEANGGEADILALFADAVSGEKRFYGSSSAIGVIGFKNIRFKLYGQNLNGEAISISIRTSVSFGNFDNC